MPSPQLDQFRAQNPAYASDSDAALAIKLHRKFYSHIPMMDYLGKVGVDRGDALYETRQPDSEMGTYLRQALAAPGTGETAEAAAKRQGGSLTDSRPGTGEGVARALLQGATFGAGDEIVAGGAALLDPLARGLMGRPDSGMDLGERFNAYLGREQGSISDFRQDNPVAAYGSEIAGAIPTSILASAPAAAARVGGLGKMAIGAADAAVQGAVYGFAGTDGGLEERASGAAIGAPLGVAGHAAGKVIGSTYRNITQNAATKKATQSIIDAAPSAAAHKQGSKAAFKASEDSGAVVGKPVLQDLRARTRQLFVDEGLMLPSGKVTNGYGMAKGALRMIGEYAKGEMSMKQAQALLKTVRGVARSPGAQGEFGRKLVKLVLDQFDGMRPQDFVITPSTTPGAPFNSNNGQQAIQQWRAGMAQWAKFKRTDSIEKIIDKAQYARGGFVEGLRSGFRKVLSSERRQAGFTQAELDVIRKFVNGGPVDDFLAFVQRSNPLAATVGGHIAGGLPGAIVLGGAKLAAGKGAGLIRNQGARRVADGVRATAAYGGKLPPVPPMPLPRPPIMLPAAGLGTAQQQREPIEITVGIGRR